MILFKIQNKLIQFNIRFMKFKFTILLLIFCIPALKSFAQSDNHDEVKSPCHDRHKNEIGIANSPVYLIKEKEFAYAFHVHYVRKISNSDFGIGIAYERIFDEHRHNTIGVLLNYRPVEKLNVNLSPGVTIKDENSKGDFAFHIETSYEFEIHNFHIGPALEFAVAHKDFHLSLGLHIGIGF